MHRLRLISIQHTELRRVCEHICDKLIVYTRTISIYSPTYTGAYIYMHIYHVYCSCTYIHTYNTVTYPYHASHSLYIYLYTHIYKYITGAHHCVVISFIFVSLLLLLLLFLLHFLLHLSLNSQISGIKSFIVLCSSQR